MIDFSLWLLIIPILLLVGAIAGTLAGLLGVGGGIVIVPVLYWLTETGLLQVDQNISKPLMYRCDDILNPFFSDCMCEFLYKHVINTLVYLTLQTVLLH